MLLFYFRSSFHYMDLDNVEEIGGLCNLELAYYSSFSASEI